MITPCSVGGFCTPPDAAQAATRRNAAIGRKIIPNAMAKGPPNWPQRANPADLKAAQIYFLIKGIDI
jgi:hypothetical protein